MISKRPRSVRDLADLAKVSPDTVARFERGEELKERTVDNLRHVLEEAGIMFSNDIEGDSVTLTKTAQCVTDLKEIAASIGSTREIRKRGREPIDAFIEELEAWHRDNPRQDPARYKHLLIERIRYALMRMQSHPPALFWKR